MSICNRKELRWVNSGLKRSWGSEENCTEGKDRSCQRSPNHTKLVGGGNTDRKTSHCSQQSQDPGCTCPEAGTRDKDQDK